MEELMLDSSECLPRISLIELRILAIPCSSKRQKPKSRQNFKM